MTRKLAPERDRFWARVQKQESGCWIWLGAILTDGYGSFRPGGGRQILAHRYAYKDQLGSIPTGLQLDHLCRVRACVNPAHLEPVTGRVNVLRGQTFVAENIAKTHCPYGHEYSPENTYTWRRHRSCRACASIRKRGGQPVIERDLAREVS